MRTEPAALLACLLAALIVGACGGDDDGGANATASPTPLNTAGLGTVTATGTLAFINENGDLTLANPDGSGQNPITSGGGVVDLAWNADGTTLAVAFDRGGPSVSIVQPTGAFVADVPGGTSFLWSPDGTQLAVVTDAGVVVVDKSGAEVRTIPASVRPEWSPDGSVLAVIRVGSDGLGTPVLVEVSSGDEIPLASGIEPAPTDYPILWHPAGAVIAYRDQLYEPSTGTQTALPGVASMWSPDGRNLLVSGTFDAGENATNGLLLDFSQGGKQTIGMYIREDPNGQPPWLFAHRWMAWTPDARYLFYLDPNPFGMQVRMYDTVAVAQTRHENIKGENPDISPSSTHAAFSADGDIWVFALDGSALVNVAKGTHPKFKPGE